MAGEDWETDGLSDRVNLKWNRKMCVHIGYCQISDNPLCGGVCDHAVSCTIWICKLIAGSPWADGIHDSFQGVMTKIARHQYSLAADEERRLAGRQSKMPERFGTKIFPAGVII